LIVPRRAWPALVLAVVLSATTLSGCGSVRAATQNRIDGDRLTIYVSAPLYGASSVSGQAVLRGAELALGSVHGRIGHYRITLTTLNDANIKTGTWDPGLTNTNVHAAMLNRTMIGYIGDFNSGASAISIPLLNRMEIPQISPTSTAVGLTSGGPEAAPGEPAKYYPTGRRTFARVVPNDSVQAAVLADLQRESDCQKTYVLDDGEVDGLDIADSFEVAAKSAGLDIVGTTEYDPLATNYVSLAAGIHQSGADCVLIAALTENHAVLLTRQVAAAVPEAQIFGTAGLAESTYVDPQLGGVPLALDSRILITSPALDPASYPPAGRKFFALYSRRYGAPQPAAIFGYEAMSLMLNAISRATDHGKLEAARTRVVSALFSTRDRHSVLGTYSIDARGDTSLNRYGVYEVVDGSLRFLKAMQG
jgi:branched-chain amino acid transport system substrate-binding protein